MARRSDIEAKIKALQTELENADTDDEIWIKDDTGHEIKVTGRRATAVLGRYAKLWESESTEDDTEAAEGSEDAPEGESADPAPKSGYFGRRK